MQAISPSYHVDPPHSSSAKIASPCRPSASPLFIRRLTKSLEPSSIQIADEEAISMFLNPDLNEQSPKSVGICAILPLPSIAASPICTPTASLSSQIHNEVTPAHDTDTTTTPSCASTSMTSTPTWIATPPTPPYKNMRRCNTASTRRSSLSLFTPSTSFPSPATAAMHVGHTENSINTGLKRCTSVPSRLQTASKPLLNGMDGPFVNSPKNYDTTFSIADETLGPESYTVESPSKLFHIVTVVVTDNEDASPDDKDIPCLPEVTTPEGSWSDHSVDGFWDRERNKDALRKFHALKELLATEVGYLKDLKALVTVYLRNLPTLAARALPSSSTFGRASSSFTSGPWIHSYSQLQAAALSSSSTTLPEAQNVSSVSAKESSKIQSRYLFTDSEIDSLTRNAEEILQLHEHFVRELRAILEPLSFTMDQDQDHGYQHLDNLDAAIRVVSTKFATEASRFNAYQSFCAGHPEALDIVRKALQQFPLELDSFEQRCATMVSDMLENGTNLEPGPNPSCDSTDSATSHLQSQSLMVEDRKRAMSLTSLDGTVRTLRSRSSMIMTKDSVVFPSEPKRDKSVRRIAFADYLIKPIQRICKYPLLLDQLLPSKALRLQTSPGGRSGVHVVVESAAQAMRHVATSVDEARHRQDLATQSSLIFSRISLGLASTFALPSPMVQMLTQDFLSSLGTCVLSGSLDVMHYHPARPLGQTSNIKAKYMGAFLYTGGYLILVKACKGKKYVPRHWFSLTDFEVSDVEDGAMLPCSFRLSSGEQHFELAAACKREKDSWLCSINESLTHVPAWTQEPTPSFKFDGKGELLPGSDDGESPSGLPTIRSIPQLSNTSETEFSEPFFASLRGHVKSKRKRRGYEASHPPSRRSSSTSVKAIFGPINSDIETVVIRRSSPTARLQVDQELQDVISRSCLAARSYAFTHEQELFQAPKANKLGFSRSNSGMSMAGMGRLSKHESVRVPRRRTTESFDSLNPNGSSSLSSTTTSNNRIGKKPSITSVSLKDYESNTSQNTASLPCPSPPSSRPATLRSLDNTTLSLLAAPLNNKEPSPLKPRSFVRNVKDLFNFRPISTPVSPVSVIVSHPSQNLVQSHSPLSERSLAPNIISPCWKVGSLRRRSRSVPSEPDNNNAVTILDGPEKSYSIQFTKAATSLST